MAIDLQDFTSGDTDYIARLNGNNSIIEAAIAQVQTSLSGLSSQGTITVGQLYDALFKGVTTLIGTDSYLPQVSGTTLVCKRGGAYRSVSLDVVSTPVAVTLYFAGKPAATYWLTLTSSGILTIETEQTEDAIYSVYWSGTGFSNITLIVPTYFDRIESDASRSSTALNASFRTLDDRFEANESTIKSNQVALAANTALLNQLKYRKVGCSFDRSTGLKGAIQVDFNGTIVGWSIILDVPGDCDVEVSCVSNAAPPMAPSVPDEVADKISASAPISTGGLQAASGAGAQVSTWLKDVLQWDVIQFNVINATFFTKGTLYVRIQQT